MGTHMLPSHFIQTSKTLKHPYTREYMHNLEEKTKPRKRKNIPKDCKKRKRISQQRISNANIFSLISHDDPNSYSDAPSAAAEGES